MIEYVLYVLFLLSLLIALIAQIRVKTTFNRYSRQATASGLTAAQVARMLLDREGLENVQICRVGGKLTDHYDPRCETLFLSDSVYDNRSAAAIGVAAHEAGHAIQHARDYLPLTFRSKLVPVTNFASRAAWVFIIIGIILYALSELGYAVALVGLGLYSMTTLFQLVTLPCEFDASGRAIRLMKDTGYFTRSDLSVAKKTLRAAAMTYVAALLTSILQLLRIFYMVRNVRR